MHGRSLHRAVLESTLVFFRFRIVSLPSIAMQVHPSQ